MDHIPVHFDIPAENPKALAKFYGKLFGWEIERTEGPVEYWLISTSPEEGKGMGGGIGKKRGPESTTN